MITEHFDVNGTEFTVTANNLIIWRYDPFGFSLTGISGEIIAPPITVISNDNYSKQGAIDSIEYIKNKALNLDEIWSANQLQAIAKVKTIFIVYYGFDNIMLRHSDNTLSIDELHSLFPSAEKYLLSNDISPEGLVNLVDGLLNWMKEA